MPSSAYPQAACKCHSNCTALYLSKYRAHPCFPASKSGVLFHQKGLELREPSLEKPKSAFNRRRRCHVNPSRLQGFKRESGAA